MFWRPRSILQLVLLGLVTVIAPLCVAIVYTVQTLDELAQESGQISESVVSLTRESQLLQSNLLDLERRARQYETLGEANLFSLFVREHQQIADQLQQIGLILQRDDSVAVSSLLRAKQSLAQILQSIPLDEQALGGQLELFAPLSQINTQFQALSQSYVDMLLQQHRDHTQEIKDSLLLMVSLLSVLTVTFALLFIYWINTPIKQIETEIRQLGNGKLTHEITISGPMEMQALGRQLEWLRTRLHELETQKQQFLRHMSHELKTPLASLREGADLMAEGVVGTLQHKQREIIRIIQNNSKELQRLIENLLDYNQMLSSDGLRIEQVNLRALLQELLQSYRISIKQKQLSVHCSGDPDNWCLDSGKLKTALDNLLSNAVNYTPKQGRIEITWRVEQAVLVIDVANSGQTIDTNEAKKIFQPFYQGRAGRTGPLKGSGIGLSVARECVLAQGGTLALVDHPQLPVCFRLQCPTLKEAAA